MGWFIEKFIATKAIRYSEELCELLGEGLADSGDVEGICKPRDHQTHLWDFDRLKFKRVKCRVQKAEEVPFQEWRISVPGDNLGLFLFPAYIQVTKEPTDKCLAVQEEENCRDFKVEAGTNEGSLSSTVKRFLPDLMTVSDDRKSKKNFQGATCEFSIVEPFLKLTFAQRLPASDYGLSCLIPPSAEVAAGTGAQGSKQLRKGAAAEKNKGPRPEELATHVVRSLVLGLRLEGDLFYGKAEVGAAKLAAAAAAFAEAGESTRASTARSSTAGSPRSPQPPSTPAPDRPKSRGSISKRGSLKEDRPKSRGSEKLKKAVSEKLEPLEKPSSRVDCLEYTWQPRDCPEGPFTGRTLDQLFHDVDERWRGSNRANPWRWPVIYIEADESDTVRKETYQLKLLGDVEPGHHDTEGRCSVCLQTMRYIQLDTKTLVLEKDSLFHQCHSCYDKPPVQAFYCARCDLASPLCKECGDDPRHQNPIEFSSMTEEVLMVSCRVPFARKRLPDLKEALSGKSGFHSPRHAERLLSPFLTQLSEVLDMHPEQIHVVQVEIKMTEGQEDDDICFEVTFCKAELAYLLGTSASTRGALAYVPDGEPRRRQVSPLQLFLEFREIFQNGQLRADLAQNEELTGLHAVDFDTKNKAPGAKLQEIVVTNHLQISGLYETFGAEAAETRETQLWDAFAAVFSTFDADKDELLKPSEFMSLQNMLVEALSAGDLGSEFVLAVFNLVDRQARGMIDFQEYVDAQNEIIAQFLSTDISRKDWVAKLLQVDKEMKQIRKEEAKLAKKDAKGAEQVFTAYARVKPADLNQAVIQGDQEKVNLFCQRGADVNALDPKGDGSLHVASFHGLPEIASILIRFKGKVDVRDNNGKVPLDLAHEQQHLPVMEILLQSGAQLYHSKSTALFDAVRNNNHEAVALLVKGGADRGCMDMKRRSPVDHAWEEQRFWVCETLVLEGVQFNKHVSSALLEYMTGIHSVGVYGNRNQGDAFVGDNVPDETHMAKMLVMGGADLKAIDEDSGNTAYHLCANHRGVETAVVLAEAANEEIMHLRNALNETCLDVAAGAGNWDVAQAFVDKGAEFEEGRSYALFKPVRDDDVKAVDICVRGKALVDVHNDRQDTPLHLACERGNVQIAKMLLGAPMVPNLNAVNTFKATPLHQCAAKGFAEIAKAIVETENVDVNAENYKGFTALDLAMEYNHTAVSEILVAAGAKSRCMGPEKLFDALLRDDDKAVAAIVNARVELESKDGEGKTCLHVATERNNAANMRLLIHSHASVNAQNMFAQDTPLMLAARLGFVDMAAILFEQTPERLNNPETCFCEVNLLNMNKMTALDVALDSEHVEVAELIVGHGGKLQKRKEDSLLLTARSGKWDWIPVLLQGGANVAAVDAGDESRSTACHVLAEKGGVESIRQIASYKADVNVQDRWERSALHLASAAGCIEALFKAQADLNLTDRNLRTPLHTACIDGRDQVVDAILMVTADYKKRANHIAEDIDRNTPSHLAAKEGQAEVLKVLLRRRAMCPDAKNVDGVLPSDLAKQGGHKAALEVLSAKTKDVKAVPKSKAKGA